MNDNLHGIDGDEPYESHYANCFRVGHNEFEFVFVLGEYRGGQSWPRWYSRTITAPTYAKELARILAHSIDQYEAKYGPIKRIPESDVDDGGSGDSDTGNPT
jgi:hypothetical protein